MRAPTIQDVPWIYEAYKDWPPTPHKGFATFEKVEGWVRRWIYRDDEVCLVYEALIDGNHLEPVGLITYRQNMMAAVVDNIVVHPDHRRKGHANAMIAELTKHLFDQGALVATFETLPGPIQDKYPEGVVTAWG